MNAKAKLRSAWNSAFFLAAFYCYGHTLTIINRKGAPGMEFVTQLRTGFVISTLSIVVFLLFVRKSKLWNLKLAKTLFFSIFGSNLVISWMYHMAIATSGLPWTPYQGFKISFLVLAIVAPISYAITSLLMLTIGIECIAIWQVLDLSSRSGVILAEEPWSTMMYFAVSAGLLFFRYRDEQMIHRLSQENAKTEALNHVARVFLSVRDRANTPLQTLKISSDLLRRQYPETRSINEAIDKSVQQLSQMNLYLSHVESKVPWKDKKLLSSQEILDWAQENKRTPSH